jgi:cytochrome c oxidase subunit 3
MADVAAQHGAAGVYEPSLFGTYSKKIGMWLFLLSDSLTFGALLFAYTYGRVSTPDWPTPFHSESIRNATLMTAFLLTSSLTMVLAVRAAVDGRAKAQRMWLLATMACGIGFIILHGREWSNLIAAGLTLPLFPTPPGQATAEFARVSKNVPQFAATFFGLTGMHMLHVTIGVVYLGVWLCVAGPSPSCWGSGWWPGSPLPSTALFTTRRIFFCWRRWSFPSSCG